MLELPAAEGALGIFGSRVDTFMVPPEDVGADRGIDQGDGGRILITPPGYDARILAGYLHVSSAHYKTVAWLRIAPESFETADMDAAIQYLKKLRLYPPIPADRQKDAPFVVSLI